MGMTFLQAIRSMESMCAAMNLRGHFGEELLPEESAACVGKYHGAVWDEVQASLASGAIDSEIYIGACRTLIDEFEQHRFRERVEKNLRNLALDQRELA
jgi:hypothetical protein